jgi:hypothetical protein
MGLRRNRSAERQSYQGLNEPSELFLNLRSEKRPDELKKSPLNLAQKNVFSFYHIGLALARALSYLKSIVQSDCHALALNRSRDLDQGARCFVPRSGSVQQIAAANAGERF